MTKAGSPAHLDLYALFARLAEENHLPPEVLSRLSAPQGEATLQDMLRAAYRGWRAEQPSTPSTFSAPVTYLERDPPFDAMARIFVPYTEKEMYAKCAFSGFQDNQGTQYFSERVRHVWNFEERGTERRFATSKHYTRAVDWTLPQDRVGTTWNIGFELLGDITPPAYQGLCWTYKDTYGKGLRPAIFDEWVGYLQKHRNELMEGPISTVGQMAVVNGSTGYPFAYMEKDDRGSLTPRFVISSYFLTDQKIRYLSARD